MAGTTAMMLTRGITGAELRSGVAARGHLVPWIGVAAMRASDFLLLLLLVVASATAQPVYESRDNAGPVFSDSPSTGARELVLPPLADPAPQPPPASSSVLPAPPVVEPYTALNIVAPDNGGTIHSNTGQFTVQVSIQPDLQSQRGDALAISLDRTVLPTTRSVLQFDITPSEWQAAAGDDVEHQLAVAVVDRTGAVLMTSAPVRFYVHRASVAAPRK